MLQNTDFSKKVTKEDYALLKGDLEAHFTALSLMARAKGMPVIILFEGFGASGKGSTIKEIISGLDPRFFKVYAIGPRSEDELRKPYMARYWNKTPENGQISILDRSWYREVSIDNVDEKHSLAETLQTYKDINIFEHQLIDSGAVIIKFFLHISKEEQERRFKKLLSKKETAWRVNKSDLQHHKDYKKHYAAFDTMLENTNSEHSPWNIIAANDKKSTILSVYQTLVKNLTRAIYETEERKKNEVISFEGYIPNNGFNLLPATPLQSLNLAQKIEREEYKQELKKLQKRLGELHNELYLEKRPVVIVYEGNDAAGKGGNIKRLTYALDPRGYEVIPIAAPSTVEKNHHYLWRFYQHLPRSGHITIFDRSWYGRVMVERIEGFCSQDEWTRAYREINEFEENLTNSGVIVVKFWLSIDKDEQLARFTARQNDPAKLWKITEEDWRNREKWDAYETAVNHMIEQTNTSFAPWTLVEANDKCFARMKTIKTLIAAIENVQRERKRRHENAV